MSTAIQQDQLVFSGGVQATAARSKNVSLRRPKRFLLTCFIIAPILCLGLFALREHSQQSRMGDFAQYYMGGAIALRGQWNALYPTPIVGAEHNPGGVTGSEPSPRYAQLADELGVGNSFRFIQPPIVAYGLLPLAWMSYATAHIVFVWCMAASLAAVAVMTGMIHARINPDARIAPGLVTLCIAVAPTTILTAQTGNLSPLVAGMVAIAVLGMVSSSTNLAAGGVSVGGILLGTLAKYAPAVLTPIFIVVRGWRGLIMLTIGAVACVALSIAIAGFHANVQYLQLWRAFDLPEFHEGNHSLQSFLVRATGQWPLPSVVAVPFGVLRIGTLALLLAVIAWRRVFIRRSPYLIAAAATGLLSWFLVFSPLAQGHYFLYLFPLMGFAVEFMRREPWGRWLIVPALMLLAVPLAGSHRWQLPLVLSVHMLWAGLAFLAAALIALHAPLAELAADRGSESRSDMAPLPIPS